MRAYQDNLNLPFQTYRRRSLPGLPSTRVPGWPALLEDNSLVLSRGSSPGQYQDRLERRRRKSFTGRITGGNYQPRKEGGTDQLWITEGRDQPRIVGDGDQPWITEDRDQPMIVGDGDQPWITEDRDQPMIVRDRDQPWITKECDQLMPGRPPCPRPSLQLHLEPENPYYQAHTPVQQAPQLMLELASEESSRRPSRCSGVSGSCTPSSIQQSCQSQSGFLRPSPYGRRISRRASHTDILRNSTPEHVDPSTPLLTVPGARSRGSSLPDQLSSSELYRLRNFATSGRKVINKGDSFRSRNSSLKSSRSR